MTEKEQKSDNKVHINLTFPPSPPPPIAWIYVQ